MASQGEFSAAMTNRSLRTIRTELEFLTDASVITPQQLANLLSQLPNQTQLHAPVISASGPIPAAVQSPVQSTESASAFTPPAAQLQNTSLNEKTSTALYPSPAPPPPAYAQQPPVLSVASAMYAYAPTDAGDLALQPNDRIQVLEHMNNDWWRGRNERTNQEGIFPRSYVRVLDEKPAPPVLSPQPTTYGNMPLEVSQTGSSVDAAGRRPSKFEEQGKKFGRKMGNAAIFGAGATIGSNIVNGIF